MLYAQKESLEDRAIRLLLIQSHTVKSLRKILVSEGVKPTLQGIYKALHFLVTEEVVIKSGFTYALNQEWRAKMATVFSRSSHRLDLAEGESMRIDLTSLVHLDQQWKNIMLTLHEAYPTYPLFLYNPHDIWKHLGASRRKSEDEYYGAFNKNNVFVFLALGGHTRHESVTKKLRQSDFIQVATGKEYFKRTDHPVIFGDYTITTKLSGSIARKIEECFDTALTEEELDIKIAAISIEKKRVKLIIERNKAKAKLLRKRMSANFHVPSALRKEFDLF